MHCCVSSYCSVFTLHESYISRFCFYDCLIDNDLFENLKLFFIRYWTDCSSSGAKQLQVLIPSLTRLCLVIHIIVSSLFPKVKASKLHTYRHRSIGWLIRFFREILCFLTENITFVLSTVSCSIISTSDTIIFRTWQTILL